MKAVGRCMLVLLSTTTFPKLARADGLNTRGAALDTNVPQSKKGETTAMSNRIATLLTRNLYDVFGQNDPAHRRAAIDEIFNEDCVFYDPMGNVYRGRDEIDRVAGKLRTMHPDFQYQLKAEPEIVGDGGRVQWTGGRPGQAPEVAGTDVIISRGGRIAAIYLFFDKLK